MDIDMSKLDSKCFNGIYKELRELIGLENTIIVHKNFKGQYVTFPKNILSNSYIHEQILKEYHEKNEKNVKELAAKYNFTCSWINKLVKKMKEDELNSQILRSGKNFDT